MIRFGDQVWWSGLVVRFGDQVWWSGLVVRFGGQVLLYMFVYIFIHRAAFMAVLDSMRKMGFNEEEIADVLKLLAAVLLIGDIVRHNRGIVGRCVKRGGGGGGGGGTITKIFTF